MPEIKHGWAHMYLDDPADRKLLIESGVIWRCGQKAVQMAVEDLVDGVVPMNDKVPPEIAAIIQKIQESRAKLAPNGLDATPAIDAQHAAEKAADEHAKFTKDIAAKSK